MSVTQTRTEDIVEGLVDVYAPSADITLVTGGKPAVSSNGTIRVPDDIESHFGTSLTADEKYDATVALFSYLATGHEQGNYGGIKDFVREEFPETPNIAALACRAVEDAHVDAHRFGNFQGLEANHDVLIRTYINGQGSVPHVGQLASDEALVEGFRQLALFGTVNGLDAAPRHVRQTLVWVDRRLNEATGQTPRERRETAAEVTERIREEVDDASVADERASDAEMPFRPHPTIDRETSLGKSVKGAAEKTGGMLSDTATAAGKSVLKMLVFPFALVGAVILELVRRIALVIGASEAFQRALGRIRELAPEWLLELFDFGFWNGSSGGSNKQSRQRTSRPVSTGGRQSGGSSKDGRGSSRPAGSTDDLSDSTESEQDSSDDDRDDLDEDVLDLSVSNASEFARAATNTSPASGSPMMERTMQALENTDTQTDGEVSSRKSDRNRRIGSHGDVERVMNEVKSRGISDEIQQVFAAYRPVQRREHPDNHGHRLNMREVAKTNAGRGAYSDQMYLRDHRETSGKRSVGVAVDLSKSMDVFEAKVALAALAEATEMTEDELSAIGFATGDDDVELPLITAPSEDFDLRHLTSIEKLGLTPTADGIRDIRQLLKRSNEDDRVAIVITDGLPNIPLGGGDKDSGAGMRAATEQVEKTRRDGISVIGIGVGDVNEEKMEEVFGEEGYVSADSDNLADELLDVYEKQLTVTSR